MKRILWARVKLWLFRLIVVALPFALFGLVEGSLRVLGYGSSYPLFVESAESRQYLVPNPNVIERYFAAPIAPSLSIQKNYLLKRKPPDGLRIFVQGGSTAAGFPVEANASIAGMLGERLRQSFPDRPVEVVNTAMSAVNSYTLLDFADEILDQAPDAIVIYAGHNEFLGILGSGSTYAIAGSRVATLLLLELNALRITQGLRELYVRTRLRLAGREPSNTTLMAIVARDKDIPLGSEAYRRGIAQFRGNMARLIQKYRAAGVPVFLATVASNLAGQAPFSSRGLPESVAVELQPMLSAIEAGRDEALTPAVVERLEALAAAHASADAYFAAGRARAARGEHEQAKQNFTLARDHDLLRFRSPSEINEIIRTFAELEGVHLVDANARLEEHAPNGLIGYQLMLEHLHPTVEGYFLIADAFYSSLRDSGVLGAFPRVVSTEAARRDIPVLAAERYVERAAIAELTADYPFTDAPRAPQLPPVRSASDALGRAYFEGEISWMRMAEESRSLVAGDPAARALASRLMAEARPYRPDLSYLAGTDLAAVGRLAEAVRYLRRAAEHAPRSIDYQVALLRAYLRQERFEEAASWVDSILALDPDNAAALGLLDSAPTNRAGSPVDQDR